MKKRKSSVVLWLELGWTAIVSSHAFNARPLPPTHRTTNNLQQDNLPTMPNNNTWKQLWIGKNICRLYQYVFFYYNPNIFGGTVGTHLGFLAYPILICVFFGFAQP